LNKLSVIHPILTARKIHSTQFARDRWEQIKAAKQLMPLSLLRLERVKGIEPSSQPWEGHILPLNHTRKDAVSFLAERNCRGNSKTKLKMGKPGSGLPQRWYEFRAGNGVWLP
jgi:hypothetical protein